MTERKLLRVIETSTCKWCVAGNVPEFSPHTNTYIHRFDTLDRACESQFGWNHKNIELKREARRIAATLAGEGQGQTKP